MVAGPNGGYLAAIVARALIASTAPEHDERPLRSLGLHYLKAPDPGPARVVCEVDRVGRSVTFARARLEQDGRRRVSAMAVFADAREGVELTDARMPDVPAPEDIPSAPQAEGAPPFGAHFDFRPAFGAPLFSGAERAETGGWLRLRAGSPLDAPYVAALTDSWFPAIFAASTGPLAVPTLDLTVHLRAPLPRPDDWVLAHLRTRVAREGLLEEDGLLFSRDGELLAQSRQLALAV